MELAFWGSATADPLLLDVAAWYLTRQPSIDPRTGRACDMGSPALLHVRRGEVPCHVAIAATQIAVGVTAAPRNRARGPHR